VGFGIYVTNFGSYNATYGSLAGVIMFLLWLWITNNAFLFGAEGEPPELGLADVRGEPVEQRENEDDHEHQDRPLGDI
ncbi:YhjD/YihY/BrkB family envelope integrity protein, partial [Klebsiella pneumoniae]